MKRPAAPPRAATALSRRPRFVWAGRLGALLLKTWGRTWRIEREIPASVLALEREGRPFVHAFFHEHILSLTYAYRDRGVVILVSESADGEYISQIIHRLGYGTVRGSTSRNAIRALLGMARCGRSGCPLGVTPDGPKGPRRVVQSGVLQIAQRAGQPIVAHAVGVRPAWRARSWDRFEVPWPWARVRVFAAEPLELDPDIPAKELEARYLAELEARFAEIETRAEAFAPAARGREGGGLR